MFTFTKEKELQQFVINNFQEHFNFDFVAEEVVIPNGRIDILGKDENNIYVIELKRDEVTEFTISQLSSYLPHVVSLFPGKNIIGIAVAPKVNKKLDNFQLPMNISTKILKNVECDESKITKRNGLRNRKTISTAVNTELYEQLKELSEKTRIQASKLLDEAIEDLLKKHLTK